MRPFSNPQVAHVFDGYPPAARNKLLALRELIFNVAANTEGVGDLEETLKWGEPAYLTSTSKSGSTVRIGWKKSAPAQYAMYFNCRTNLVGTFRTIFPRDFDYGGNRAIVLGINSKIPAAALAVCVGAALTYHLKMSRI